MKQALVFLFFVVAIGPFALGQSHDSEAHQKGQDLLTQSGKMLTLSLEPAGSQLRFYVTGKEAASLKLNEKDIEVTYGLSKEPRKLVFHKVVDPHTKREVYIIEKLERPVKNLQISIRSNLGQEKFVIPDLK